MSRSPFFFVEMFNTKTNKYELCHPYVWNMDFTKLVPAELVPYNGWHDLFSIVEQTDTVCFPRMKGIHHTLPSDTCDYIKELYDKQTQNDIEDFGITHVSPHWFTYADMLIYLLEHPEVKNYEAMDYTEREMDVVFMPNPVQSLKNRVDAFLDIVMDGWYDWQEWYTSIRIVYWIF